MVRASFIVRNPSNPFGSHIRRKYVSSAVPVRAVSHSDSVPTLQHLASNATSVECKATGKTASRDYLLIWCSHKKRTDRSGANANAIRDFSFVMLSLSVRVPLCPMWFTMSMAAENASSATLESKWARADKQSLVDGPINGKYETVLSQSKNGRMRHRHQTLIESPIAALHKWTWIWNAIEETVKQRSIVITFTCETCGT